MLSYVVNLQKIFSELSMGGERYVVYYNEGETANKVAAAHLPPLALRALRFKERKKKMCR